MDEEIDRGAVKRREARLRRLAAGLGLALRKSRARDKDCMDFGCYRIVNPKTDYVVAGRFPFEYSLSLDAVEEVLDELQAAREDSAIKEEWLQARAAGGAFDAKHGL
jgi:hypothetical protein